MDRPATVSFGGHIFEGRIVGGAFIHFHNQSRPEIRKQALDILAGPAFLPQAKGPGVNSLVFRLSADRMVRIPLPPENRYHRVASP